MRIRKVVVGLGIVGIVICLCLLLYSGQTTYALGSCRLTLVFLVTDADTHQPIPDATIKLHVEDHIKAKAATLITDGQGKAELVRDSNSCEDIIRPFRKTKTLIDLTWAVVTVSAKGYRPTEQIWLHTYKYETTEQFLERRSLQLVFRIPLEKDRLASEDEP